MISKTAEYAMRAMAVLGRCPGPVVARDIATATGVPRSYLSKVLHILGRAGLVESERGPGGGFCLGRPAKEITAYDIVSQFDSLDRGRKCLLGRLDCRDPKRCGACDGWTEVWRAYEGFLRSTNLDGMAINCMSTMVRAKKKRGSRPS